MNKFIRLITFNNIKKIVINNKIYKNFYYDDDNRVYEMLYDTDQYKFMKGFEVKVKQKILKSFPHIIINSDEKLDLKDIVGIDSYRKTSEDYGALLLKGKMSIVQIKGLDYDADSYLINEDVDSIVLKDGRLPIVINKELSIEIN